MVRTVVVWAVRAVMWRTWRHRPMWVIVVVVVVIVVVVVVQPIVAIVVPWVITDGPVPVVPRVARIAPA